MIAATDLSKLYDEFQDAFNARSEDAAQCPFASLQTHNELTAAWFEFFLKNAEHFGISDEMPDAKTLRKRKYEFSKKLLALIRIKLTVNSKLARLRDSKIIKDVPEILQSLRQAVNGVTIYDLSDEVLVAAIPGEAENFPEKVRAVLGQRTNYYVETTVVNSILSNKEFLHTFNKLFVPYEMNLYPAIQDEITTIEGNEASHKAIICDMCQMAQARHLYPRDAYPGSTEIEPIEESLCDGCFDVRKDADKAKNLAKWEDEENVSAAFFKVHIDMAGLTAFLKKMFKDVFLKDEILDDDLGFSIIKEFLHDYKRFLAAFKDEVLWHEDYGKSENHERIMDDLFCIKVKKAGDIKPLVRCYTEMLESNQFFSSMAKFGAARRMVMPIRLSVTVSSVKYPFMESWRRLNEPNEEINIYAIPNVKLEVRLAKFKRLMDSGIEKKRVSAALHKLAEIEDRTDNQFLTKVAMLDMKGDLEDLAIPLITTGELSLKETLAFYKIMKGAEKR